MSNNLPLKDFIVSTLTNICEAVEESRNLHGEIATQAESYPSTGTSSLIEFDLAVTTNDESQKAGQITGGVKAVISVVAAKLSSNVDAKTSTSEKQEQTIVNRIKFNVPVYFRLDKEAYKKHKENEKNPISFRPTGIV